MPAQQIIFLIFISNLLYPLSCTYLASLDGAIAYPFTNPKVQECVLTHFSFPVGKQLTTIEYSSPHKTLKSIHCYF